MRCGMQRAAGFLGNVRLQRGMGNGFCGAIMTAESPWAVNSLCNAVLMRLHSPLPHGFTEKIEVEDDKIRTALLQAYATLVEEQVQVVRLFTPAFDDTAEENPGYIAAYPPGVRENGGQYTHAAVWLAMGLFRAGLRHEGETVLTYLLPANHAAKEYLGRAILFGS